MRAFSDLQRPAVVGHRGYPAAALENTPASLTAAVAAGAGWVEVDVRRTRDDAVVLHHDPFIAEGTAIVEATVAQLQRHGIVTLAEALASLPADVGIDLEVKNLPGEPDYDEAAAVVGLLAAELVPEVGSRPLMTSSFNPLTVAALTEALPDVPAGFLHSAGVRVDAALPVAVEFGAAVLCPHADAPGLGPEAITAAHDAGLEVMVWTVDDARRALQLAGAGVDALCTNEPARLVAALKR